MEKRAPDHPSKGSYFSPLRLSRVTKLLCGWKGSEALRLGIPAASPATAYKKAQRFRVPFSGFYKGLGLRVPSKGDACPSFFGRGAEQTWL